MANNSLATVKTNDLSVKGATDLVTNVKEGLALVSKGYLAITPDVAKLYDCKGYKALGYKNFDELCAIEFGMSHGTTVGIRKVFDKFGTKTQDNKYMIPEKYMEFGYTKLLLMTDKKFTEAGINPLEMFTPDMTIADMRNALTEKLSAKADKQDNEAIDVTPSEEASENASENASEVPFTDNELSPSEEFDCIVDELKKWQDKNCSNFKPEKAILFDSVYANLSEIYKVWRKLNSKG